MNCSARATVRSCRGRRLGSGKQRSPNGDTRRASLLSRSEGVPPSNWPPESASHSTSCEFHGSFHNTYGFRPWSRAAISSSTEREGRRARDAFKRSMATRQSLALSSTPTNLAIGTPRRVMMKLSPRSTCRRSSERRVLASAAPIVCKVPSPRRAGHAIQLLQVVRESCALRRPTPALYRSRSTLLPSRA